MADDYSKKGGKGGSDSMGMDPGHGDDTQPAGIVDSFATFVPLSQEPNATTNVKTDLGKRGKN